ncbi:hypothetical protein N7491_007931 [Penicillium cf. griseofulvum]|nr:hypothetical protein N7491_007931 [Penicillium cf. griseofulvum]
MSYPQHPQQAYPPGPPQQPYGYPPQGYDQQYNQGYVPPGVPQYGAPQGQQVSVEIPNYKRFTYLPVYNSRISNTHHKANQANKANQARTTRRSKRMIRGV